MEEKSIPPPCYRSGSPGMATAKSLKELSFEDIKTFIESFDDVVCDCDGVLWIGNNAIEGSPEVMNAFKKMGKNVYFVTNNSTKSREEFLSKCHNLGFNAEKEDIISSAYLAAVYLSDLGFKRKVYVVGSTGITKELADVGIDSLPVGPDVLNSDVATYIKTSLELDNEVGAVIVGFDDHISFVKILKAVSYLENPDVIFLATNTDERFPSERKNVIIPGSGCMVRAVETAALRKPIILGKPSPFLCDVLKNKVNANKNSRRTLVIGDRGNTDISLGTKCNFQTLLVLTGVTKLEEIAEWKQSEEKEVLECVPDFYIQKLGDLGPFLKKLHS